jgi:hypothetical protein
MESKNFSKYFHFKVDNGVWLVPHKGYALFLLVHKIEKQKLS